MSSEDKGRIDGDDLEALCSELDSLSVRMLCLMREYIDCKANIEDLIKSGSLHLAKSRYIMGNRSVSALQLPTEDGAEVFAQTTILRKEDHDSLTLELNRLSLIDTKLDSQTGLKSRPTKLKEETTRDNDEPAQVPLLTDPLKWFGVLVPQNLRHAQSYFNKAIELVLQAANIQLDINNIEKRFVELMGRKKKLEEMLTEKDS